MLFAVVSLVTTEMKAQVSIAPEAGVYNSATNYESNTGNTLDKKSKIAPRAGVNLNFHLYKRFFIQTGLFYYMSGSKLSETNSFLGTTTGFASDITIHNLQIPVSLGYDYPLGKAGSLFATAGPYIGMGIKGKSTTDNYSNDNYTGTSNTNYTFGGKAADNMKRFDLGFNFSVGYKTPFGVFVRGQYGLGVTQLSNNATTSIRNAGFSGTIGYEFKLSKKKVQTENKAKKV